MLSIGVFLFTSWTPSSSPAPGYVIGAVRLGAHPAMSTDGPTPTVQDAPAVPLADALLSNAANDVVYRRAEFWDRGSATLLEVINVLGRFEKCVEFRERTQFAECENSRVEDERQAETRKRYDLMGANYKHGQNVNPPPGWQGFDFDFGGGGGGFHGEGVEDSEELVEGF